ncbi:MAG: hypothetical protein HY075_13780 [Deltaproteobacteria bacterium]|nr:hypothetical protein [Deltaproteobacteria bacterium]
MTAWQAAVGLGGAQVMAALATDARNTSSFNAFEIGFMAEIYHKQEYLTIRVKNDGSGSRIEC